MEDINSLRFLFLLPSLIGGIQRGTLCSSPDFSSFFLLPDKGILQDLQEIGGTKKTPFFSSKITVFQYFLTEVN